MTEQLVNALYGYFETLYDLNRNIITLCGVDVIDNAGLYEKIIADIIQAIPRLVPYVYDKEKEVLIITKRDGLLEFAEEIPFLNDKYDNLLQQHYDFLSNAKTIRNKFEHKMHAVKLVSSSSGTMFLFDLTYEIGGNRVTITAQQIITFVKQLNLLFSALQTEIETYAYQNQKSEYTFYRRLTRFDFKDFNKIYDNEDLRLFGQTLFPF